MNFTEQISGYMSCCDQQKKLNGKTMRAYQIDLKQFRKCICDDLSKPALIAYVQYLHRTFSPRSVKRKLASVRAFLNYLEYEGLIADNPLKKIQIKFQEPQTLPRALPFDLIQLLLSAAHRALAQATADKQARDALRDLAILELMFATGMRVSELCSLGENDLDLDDRSVRILGKGARERILQIENREVCALLARYCESYHAEISACGYFFINRRGARMAEQSVRTMIRKYCKNAGIELHVTPHILRHSFATLLLEEDVDIRYIQKMLGHSSITTTQIYTQVASQKQRSILATKHPRNKMCLYTPE